MPNYRRAHVPGGTFFLTAVTYERRPVFADARAVALLRQALGRVKRELPFEIPGAVVLPDHVHFLWSLPRGDTDYSKRIGLTKVLTTRWLCGVAALPDRVSPSRRRRHEGDVWQRRFWEHTITDEDDFERHLDYIHYNPVKHGLVGCPHQWRHSSFSRWVERGAFPETWGCTCGDRRLSSPKFQELRELDFE